MLHAPPITRSPDHARSPDFSAPPKRLFQRRTLRRKELSALRSNVHAVFQAYAEFAADVATWFVAKTHRGRNRRGIAADQIGPFVSVHADSVANAMAEVFVVRAVTGVADDFARGCVHGLALGSGLRHRQRCGLRSMHNIEHFLHFVGRLAQNYSAADVGFVVFDFATAVHHKNRPFTYYL